eukprot:TRINITY_DN10654_c0_g1_i2.p2 TRINITY_DN10654_c0_g1~~TRINITY_DN10654_c0_g1_i2.p2  ORF type:complete len:130 (+),score=43.34 TRINITY_DN10654_c0_g1_i2:201-590(+)
MTCFDPVIAMAVLFLQQLKQFDDNNLMLVTNEGLDVDDENEKKKFEELKAKFGLLSKLTKKELGDTVEEVEESSRSVDSMCVFLASEYDLSVNVEGFMKVQALPDNSITAYIKVGLCIDDELGYANLYC